MPKQVTTLQIVGYQRVNYWAGIEHCFNTMIHIVGWVGLIWIGSLVHEWMTR